MPLKDCRSITQFAEGLAAGEFAGSFANEPPSLLHGDLWAGNHLVDTNGVSWLIDPAAHCGHREFDLAMMQLFGGYSQYCYSAYHEAYPLQSGAAARVALHQLAPLLVHVIKFGGSYEREVKGALDTCKNLIP